MTRGAHLGVLPLLALSVSCAQWPRSANLEADTGLHSTVDQPRLTVHTSWTRVSETTPDANDSTVQSRDAYPLVSLGIYDASGYLLSGDLEGVDWDASATHQPLVNEEQEGCEDAEGVPLVVGTGGDYAGDLDYFLFEVQEDALLCATAIFEDPGEVLGVDLLVVQLDECSLPEQLVMDPSSPSQPLGYLEATDSPVEWSTSVSAGDTIALFLSGYARRVGDTGWEWGWDEGPDLTAPYHLGVSIVPAVDGQQALCPLLPEEPS